MPKLVKLMLKPKKLKPRLVKLMLKLLNVNLKLPWLK